MKKITILFVLSLITLSTFSNKRNVPGTYSTIQSALNACGTGDTVLVQPGIYSEHLVWPNIGKIKLFSAGDSSNTIIDATLNGRCITISSPTAGLIDTTTIIKGFKLRNGYSDTITFNGVAIYASYASVKLLNLAICNNQLNILNSTGFYNGGVCYFRGGYSSLINCSVYSNTVNCSNLTNEGLIISAGDVGCTNFSAFNNSINVSSTTAYIFSTGMLFYSRVSQFSSSNFKNLKITNNNVSVSTTTAAAVLGGLFAFMDFSGAITFNLDNALMANNSFSIGTSVTVDGLLCYSRLSITYTYLNIRHCTFTNNFVFGSPIVKAKSLEVYGYGGTSSNCGLCNKYINIYNSIFWNPSITATGPEIYTYNQYYGSTSLKVLYSDIDGGATGTGNINLNPQFVSSTDFHLQNSSSCINTGDSAIKVPFDLDGNIRPINIFPDMGCYEFNPSFSSVNENSTTNSHYTIYPNPTSNSLNIRSDKNEFENKEIEIINYLGQTVLKTPYADNISVSSLSSGYYIIKILTASGQFNSNFIKE